MRLREKQKIADAYNNLLKRLNEVGLEEIDGILGKEQVLKISENDYEILKPFLNAYIERHYKINDVELVSKERMPIGIYQSKDWIGLNVHGPINQFLCDLENIVTHIVQDPNKRSIPARYYYGDSIEMEGHDE